MRIVEHSQAVSRFWARVARRGDGECWEWCAARHERGYGRVRWKGRIRSTHRVAYEIGFGRPPADHELVLHHCDNPPCCNPDHLYIGTHADNARDRGERLPPRTRETLEHMRKRAAERARYWKERERFYEREAAKYAPHG